MYRKTIFPLLTRMDAEWAHDITIKLLGRVSRQPLLLGLVRRRLAVLDARLQVSAFGLSFPNPLGVAAGLDKNGRAVTALGALGFGHVEVGTVTPQPQAGNPKPRVFRLTNDEALINRMGFPGVGSATVQHNLRRLRGLRPVIGINLGANKTAVDHGNAVADYVSGVEQLSAYGDYLAINISSPNTARLRELQGRAALDELLGTIMQSRNRQERRRPVLVKIAPDLVPTELDDVLQVVLDHEIDGIIATNTTLARPEALRHTARAEAGGLSGRPLQLRANDVIRAIYVATNGKLPIIGVGGVFTAEDVWEKLRAGASLVQIYTGFVYGGPLVAHTINRALVQRLNAEGIAHISEIVGRDQR